MLEATVRLRTESLVPEHAFTEDAPLVATTRGGHVETLHRGILVVCRPDGSVVTELGSPEQKIFLRSSAKPFQAMALIITGAAEQLGLSQQDIAIACSSHSGESAHVEAVTKLLTKAQLSFDLLQCGVHAPHDAASARELVAHGESPSVLHNNCSGKHAGMLAVCKVMNWPLESYLEATHPLQEMNRRTLAAFGGVDPESIGVGIDGCGVPAFYLPIRAIATAFARLATGREVDPKLRSAAERVRDAMVAFPFLIGGTGRFDTDLLRAGVGDIVCKGGAQGCEGIGLRSQGIGIAVKITDGSGVPIPVAALRIMVSMGAVSEPLSEELSRHRARRLTNHAGRTVGSIEAVFSIEATG